MMIHWFLCFFNNMVLFFCRMICLWPQNMPQFLILLLHWSQISFPVAFFWSLQTASGCWGPDLENRVSVEAIQSAIPVVLPSLWSTCVTAHCLGETTLFFFICGHFFGDLFLQMHQWYNMIFAIDGSSILKVIDEQNTLYIPKCGGQNLACWCLHLWSLWIAFSCRCPLSWLLIWL